MKAAAAPLPRSLQEFEVDFQAPLGAGACGTVYSGLHRETNREVAIKVVSPAIPAAPDSVHASIGIAQETQAFKHVLQAGVSHPHVVELVGCFEGPCAEAAELGLKVLDPEAEEQVHYFVMERLGGESLEDRIQRQEGLEEEEAREVTRAICQGLAFLHGQGIVHRDVKPGNVMYAPATVGEEPKLIDFSHSGVMPDEEDVDAPWFEKVLGTSGYVAPEVLLEREPYSTKCDVYSMGCTLHAMLAKGRLPRRHPRAGIIMSLPQSTSPHASEFLDRVLCPYPEDRPTVAEVLNEPWLQ